MTGGGDWLLLQELLERGDPGFVDGLRRVTDADALGQFAARWYAHPSPGARRLLLAYLERPLNAYRHEALVKRLFKRAEAAGDDAVMARFLVAFDRSIRRVQKAQRRWESQTFDSREQAEALAALWRSWGYQWVRTSQGGLRNRSFFVSGMRQDPYLISEPGTAMPRGRMLPYYDDEGATGTSYKRFQAPDWAFKVRRDMRRAYRDVTEPPEAIRRQLERFRLFSVRTRQYLRRRAWRYFRRLGMAHPERYVAAISEALVLYEDADVDSGLALIDNWGLIHALFHHSPVLVSGPRGWKLAQDRSLSELEPAPIHEGLWRSAPSALFDLIGRARCRPVRQWAIRMLRREPAAVRNAIRIEDILGLLGHDDPEVVGFSVDWLRGADDLSTVPPERWLAVAEFASPGALEILGEIMARQIPPDRISIEAAARLAGVRSLPMARLGLGWLKSKSPASDDERRGLLALLEAECEPLRPEILAWLRSILSAMPGGERRVLSEHRPGGAGGPPVPGGHPTASFRTEWLLEFLDSRRADARAEGMAWFREEARARDDVVLWQRLMESPYDDVRFALTAELDACVKRANGHLVDLSLALSPERLRLLWASVLLNVNRGSRAKPRAVEQVAHRLARRPEEAEALLPLLAVGLRSLRAPERRAALAAVVRLVERRPDSAALVHRALPELQWA